MSRRADTLAQREWEIADSEGDRLPFPSLIPAKAGTHIFERTRAASPAFFNRVFVEFGGLTWPNGYDWSPEALHTDMAAAGGLKVESAAG